MQSQSAVRLSGHLPGLDGVRGLAILMVMSLHFIGDATPHSHVQRVVIKAAGLGLLGVDLFFVLSGFLITGILLDAKGEAHYFRNFYARRTLRIFPLYFVVLAALFLLIPAFVTPSRLFEVARVHQLWAWTYTANFYVAARSSWDALTYVTHFWSLAIEEHFYLLWPLVVFALGRTALQRVCVGIVIGGLALRLWLVHHGVTELSVSVLTPCRIDTLAVGALLAILVRGEKGPKLVGESGRLLVMLGGLLFAISLFCALTQRGLLVLHQVRTSLFALFFGSLTLLALRGPENPAAKLLRTRVLRFFGKYSYGLYVYHGLLTWYFVDVAARERIEAWVGNRPVAAMVVRAALGFGISLAIAVTSYELLERRFLALKQRFAPDAPREALPVVAVAVTPSRPPPG